MPVVIGLDVGTTSIAALALDTDAGEILASTTQPNRAEITSAADKARGYSEWDARAMAETALKAIATTAALLGERARDVAGIGVTGQQHGTLLVNGALDPLTPLIGWQDRRAEEIMPDSPSSFVARARELAGPDASRWTGCRLSAGYMAITLFWMKRTGRLPAEATACFAPDYVAALLTRQRPRTDPTLAASAGMLDLATGAWEASLLRALGLPTRLLPEVVPSGSVLGALTDELAARVGLRGGVPVFVAIGDNQASFLGSVAEPADSMLVNVGTGGQVAALGDRLVCDPLLETRPFPGGGFLLVCAGLAGGRAYATLEGFFRQVGEQLFGRTDEAGLYAAMNRLAASVPRGADGLQCEPFFAGTRHEPERRATFTGINAANFTPGHMARALLEGIARAFREGNEAIARHLPAARRRLVGAGNGLRLNPLLAGIIAEEFGMPMALPAYHEEAAFGAALVAAVGAGIAPDWRSAGKWVRYTDVPGERG